ncbi:MAG: bis(5'-nucleosyl)-tetraphosphatase (symmetrical) YqeK [Sweet potato little leaf phytoplasma]|uniref:bis(5'-nucleosyl)-tetraphosphatase (symmetrical) n=4 Tax=Candidatus Phytoplasma TaxID=33926 RepID=A0A9K3STP1_9MOLU|nr:MULTISPECIES: bis(5'-nucleosyl)-tetraphosphatase (symmetrical) YqeK [Phytoplasma]QLL36942.1 hydrolase ['Echinacea purpurea' witches'-broom phytoplasma]WEX20342.1 MAG: hydrolase [Candidatus Phytoplasma aurantifolia]EMR14733.1 hydrolase [Peanut witches'-broom phytoplasma NTU2011]MCG3566841.1 bis(5'-nucleosyl)-tetraphosphatase (symmetrical) YqeK [Sesame phyllody phytoplasma]MDO7987285.1 bis(5'-nucleosyl)-tetraphosphatase (symmetrical) YqeK [Sweet potato little leaf phytoplasma]
MLIETILKKINNKFKNDIYRLNHILGVYQKATDLALFYGENVEEAQIAALFHDYTKNESLEFHLSLLDNEIINKYKQMVFMYHAFSAPIILQKEFNINNTNIFNAIRKHVWGHEDMNKLDKIILISDKIEDSREFPNINYFRELAFKNLDQTIYELLKNNINYYSKKGFEPFPEQIKILNSLSKKIFKLKKVW